MESSARLEEAERAVRVDLGLDDVLRPLGEAHLVGLYRSMMPAMEIGPAIRPPGSVDHRSWWPTIEVGP